MEKPVFTGLEWSSDTLVPVTVISGLHWIWSSSIHYIVCSLIYWLLQWKQKKESFFGIQNCETLLFCSSDIPSVPWDVRGAESCHWTAISSASGGRCPRRSVLLLQKQWACGGKSGAEKTWVDIKLNSGITHLNRQLRMLRVNVPVMFWKYDCSL